MSEWDGRERRSGGGEDHDLLIEIANDLKHMINWSRDHDTLDTSRFLAQKQELNDQKKEINFHNKIVYGGLGIFLFVEFVIKFVK